MLADSLRYHVVYDAATAASYTDWWFPAVGVGMLAVLVAVMYRRRKTLHALEVSGFVGMAGFLVFLIVSATSAVRASHRSLRDALASGRFTRVEGRVRNFVIADPVAHRAETWEVESGGHVYHYQFSPSTDGPGFDRTTAYGGPIHEGLRVRIADVDGHIARLEIAE